MTKRNEKRARRNREERESETITVNVLERAFHLLLLTEYRLERLHYKILLLSLCFFSCSNNCVFSFPNFLPPSPSLSFSVFSLILCDSLEITRERKKMQKLKWKSIFAREYSLCVHSFVLFFILNSLSFSLSPYVKCYSKCHSN